jgi:hypothetical protein
MAGHAAPIGKERCLGNAEERSGPLEVIVFDLA